MQPCLSPEWRVSWLLGVYSVEGQIWSWQLWQEYCDLDTLIYILFRTLCFYFFQMQFVLGAVLLASCLVVTRCSDAQENVKKVKAGVDAGTAIVKALGDEKFSEAFGKLGSIAGKIGPFLGALGPALSLITMFLPGQESPELKFMKEGFAKMDANFDRVLSQFRDVKNLIEKTGVKCQYSQYEQTIKSLSTNLQEMLAAPISEIAFYKERFHHSIRKWI